MSVYASELFNSQVLSDNFSYKHLAYYKPAHLLHFGKPRLA